MNFSKTQLNHINKQLGKNDDIYNANEKDLQLDVSLHNINGIDIAKIHIATQEEVVFSEWENYLESVEDTILKEKKEKAFILNINKYLTGLFFIVLAVIFYLFADTFQSNNKIVFYSAVALLPLVFYFIMSKAQTKLTKDFYKNIFKNLESKQKQ